MIKCVQHANLSIDSNGNINTGVTTNGARMQINYRPLLNARLCLRYNSEVSIDLIIYSNKRYDEWLESQWAYPEGSKSSATPSAFVSHGTVSVDAKRSPYPPTQKGIKAASSFRDQVTSLNKLGLLDQDKYARRAVPQLTGRDRR
ncbi:hypothetical protein D3C76_288550 [compost metagenome]